MVYIIYDRGLHVIRGPHGYGDHEVADVPLRDGPVQVIAEVDALRGVEGGREVRREVARDAVLDDARVT